MDWRDLLAWQRVKTSVVRTTLISGNALKVCGQDPHRIYLSITQKDGDNPHALIPVVAQYDNAQVGVGLGIGGATFWPVPITFLQNGTFDPTGATFASTISSAVLASISAVPNTREFWLDRHGVLTQTAWFFREDGCDTSIYVIEVIQDEAPCDRKPRREVQRGRFVRGLWMPFGAGPDSNGGDDIDADSVSQCQPLRHPAQPNQSESLLAVLRRASRGG
jgi:hypothetical protein